MHERVSNMEETTTNVSHIIIGDTILKTVETQTGTKILSKLNPHKSIDFSNQSNISQASIGTKVMIEWDDPSRYNHLYSNWLEFVHMATIHKIDEENNQVLIILDDCVELQRIDRKSNCDFRTSELYEWLNTKFLLNLPGDIRARIKEVTIPTCGMILGHDKKSININSNDKLDMMLSVRYRISPYNNKLQSYWTQTKESKNKFICINSNGSSYNFKNPTEKHGIRPMFWMKFGSIN